MLKHITLTIALFLCLLLALPIPGFGQMRAQQPTQQKAARQKAEIGMPLLRNYTPKEFNASPQIWSILQDRRGALYFGATNAVLEYDGVNWRKIRVPSVGLSLALDSAGKIWVGAVTNFGFLGPDADGTLRYGSLVDKIPAEHRSFNDDWQALPISQGIFSRAYARLFRWDGRRMQVWATKTRFEALSEVRGRIYTSQAGIGLQEIVGDREYTCEDVVLTAK